MKNTTYITILLLFIFSTNINAQLYISPGATLKASGQVTITLQDIDLINEGLLDGEGSETSRIVLKENVGTTVQNFGGSGITKLHKLTIIRNNFKAQLTGNISNSGTVNFQSGILDLNGYNITLLTLGKIDFENETRRLIGPNGGYVTKTRDINGTSGVYLSGVGMFLTTTSDLGLTTFKRGHKPKTLPAGDDFERYYEIIPANNSNLDVDIRFDYIDAENPSITEGNLKLWRNSTQEGWVQQTPSSQNLTDDYIEITGIESFVPLWTFAGNQNTDNDGDGYSLAQGDCDDTDPVEVMDLTLNNNPVAEDYYIVSNQISSAGTIPTNEMTTFQAGAEIVLNVGFVANQGTDFRAFIVACGVPPAPLNAITENEVEEIFEEKEIIDNLETESNSNLQYQVFPNPMSEQGFVNLLLEKETKVEIQLFNNVGKLVKTILSRQIKNAGEHQLDFEVRNLPEGIYFVKFQINDKIETEKIVIMNAN